MKQKTSKLTSKENELNDKRVVITYSAKDPINIRLDSLLGKFEGFTLNELIKYAVIRLDESENSPKIQKLEKINEVPYKEILKPIRDQFKVWLLKNGYTNTQIENLTDEQMYEIIRKI
jgi:5'-3' exonuclease